MVASIFNVDGWVGLGWTADLAAKTRSGLGIPRVLSLDNDSACVFRLQVLDTVRICVLRSFQVNNVINRVNLIRLHIPPKEISRVILIIKDGGVSDRIFSEDHRFRNCSDALILVVSYLTLPKVFILVKMHLTMILKITVNRPAVNWWCLGSLLIILGFILR